jgi:hypothetical protein
MLAQNQNQASQNTAFRQRPNPFVQEPRTHVSMISRSGNPLNSSRGASNSTQPKIADNVRLLF